MEQYNDFSYIYDKLTEDVKYQKRVDYIEKLFSRHMSYKPVLVADIGCGTGTVCNIMYDRGYDMIGIDASCDMLNVAKEKSDGKSILYLNQSMTDFELYGTVDVILCMLDSVNYIINDNDINMFFDLCNNYLNNGGLLIFDINTEYKFKSILADNIFNYEDDNMFYTWENSFNGKICEFYLNFFVEQTDGSYNRITEQHFERCYSYDELKNAVEKSGMSVEAIYGDMCFEKPTDNEQRAYFVIKKY